jgi:hypothetical protein
MHQRWIQPIGIAALVVLYLGLWALMSRQITNPTDFDVFFLPSARIALSGHPLDIYQVRYAVWYPNANGPLSMLPLSLVAALASALGIINDFTWCRLLVAVAFAVFPLLLSYEAVRSLDILLKRPLRGIRRLLAYGVFALSPELWHSVLGYGHIEHPLMLFLVVASVRSLLLHRTNRAGVLLGLALLTRSSAILYLVPLTLLLMAERKWCAALRFGGCALLTLAIGLFPFALADRGDLIYSLVTFHGLLPIGGGAVWGVFENTSLSSIGDHYDSFFVVGSCLLLSLVLLLRLLLSGRLYVPGAVVAVQRSPAADLGGTNPLVHGSRSTTVGGSGGPARRVWTDLKRRELDHRLEHRHDRRDPWHDGSHHNDTGV